MNKASRISGVQMTVLLLASRLSGCLLLTNDAFGNMSIGSRLFAVGIGGLLLFLLCLPTLCLDGTLNTAYRLGRTAGRIVGSGYLLLCVFLLAVDVLQFHDFAEKVMNSNFSVPLLSVSLVVVAFLASLYGVAALARAALPVAAFTLVCLLVFGLALIPEMRTWYFPITTHGETAPVLRAAVAELPRTAEITVLGLLLPHTNGKKGRAVFGFAAATSAVTVVITLTALGVLGDFAQRTAYPYYTAAAAAQIGVFERMDILIVTVWLATFFVRMTLFAALFTATARRVLCQKAPWGVAVGAAVVCVVALVAPALRVSSIVTAVYWGVLGLFCVGLPLALYWLKRRCRP